MTSPLANRRLRTAMGSDTKRRAIVITSAAALAALALPRLGRAQAGPKIRIGFWPVAAGLPFFAAVDRGYFKEAGLEVEPLKFAGAQQVMEAMLSGRSDGSANGTGSANLGGQQQTASIMRALAPRPEVLFLDEPFSALDFEMTLFIRQKLQEVFMQTGTTMLLVSHDLEEAVYLADRVLLLTKRPTRVAEILPYEDARPRTAATLSEPSFVAAKKKSLEIFQREVRR